LVKAPKDSWLGRAIRMRLSRKSNLPTGMLKFIHEEGGPHGSFVPLYSLWLVPYGGEVQLSGEVKPERVDF